MGPATGSRYVPGRTGRLSRVVFATDLHLTEGQEGVRAFVDDLTEIVALSPDLLVLGGDICLWEAGAGDLLQGLLRDLPMPCLGLMGNHDTDRSRPPDELDHDFVTRFDARNGCIELGDAHVVGLNTCRMQPGFDDWRNVCGRVDADDLAWLERTLAGLDRSRPLLLFVHIPLATTYPERRGADAATTDVWRVADAEPVLQQLADWPAPVIVGQGHLHENEHLHVGRVHFVSVGSVCGRWWQQGPETRCTDESPRGWLVVDVVGGEIDLEYRAARRPAQWRGEIVDGEKGLLLNLFFGDPTELVEVSIAEEWVPLAPPDPVPVYDRFVSTHHWALPAGWSGDRLSVRSRTRDRPWECEVVRRRG